MKIVDVKFEGSFRESDRGPLVTFVTDIPYDYSLQRAYDAYLGPGASVQEKGRAWLGSLSSASWSGEEVLSISRVHTVEVKNGEVVKGDVTKEAKERLLEIEKKLPLLLEAQKRYKKEMAWAQGIAAEVGGKASEPWVFKIPTKEPYPFGSIRVIIEREKVGNISPEELQHRIEEDMRTFMERRKSSEEHQKGFRSAAARRGTLNRKKGEVWTEVKKVYEDLVTRGAVK